MKKGKLIFTLFYTMLKIGLFTFGGGYGMIALLENEFVSKRKWMSKEEFLDMIAIAESSPGPIAINSATYIGYKLAKFWGSLAATVAVCIPSFVIIFIISLFLNSFLALEYVGYAFKGIQVGVSFLIFNAGLKLLKDVQKKPLPIIILVATTICMVCFSIFAISFSSIFYILIGGAIGLFAYHICKIYDKQKAKKVVEALSKESQSIDNLKTDITQEEKNDIVKELKEDNKELETVLNNFNKQTSSKSVQEKKEGCFFDQSEKVTNNKGGNK